MIIAVFAACNAGGRDIPPRHTEMYRRDIPLEACIQSRRISRRLSRRLRVVAERHVQPEYVVWILGHAVSFAHQEVDQCVSQHVGARAPDHLDRLPRGDQTVVLLYSYADDGRLVDSALATLEEELKSLRIVLPRGRCELLPRGRYEPLGCRRCCTLYTAARTGRLPRGRYVLLGGGC